MKPRTFARTPSSIGSNQLSKSRSSASPAQAVVVLLIMAWSPVRRSNAGISRVANPGDYATPNSNHLRDGTGGLASYGVSFSEVGRLAAKYVQRILSGTNPGEPPVERVTTLSFVVNLT